MSKADSILIAPMVALQALPDVERDVLRRFFTEHVRGMDRKNDKRWRRFVRDLFTAAPGEGFQLLRVEERGGPFHRMHRAVLTRLFESQEKWTDEDVLHDWLKVKCWFVEWEQGKPAPKSTDFDSCGESEMREFHTKMVALLHQPWVLRTFWPHIAHAARLEMLEIVLTNPNEEHQ